MDATGTHELDTAQALELDHPGALHDALDEIEASLTCRRPKPAPTVMMSGWTATS